MKFQNLYIAFCLVLSTKQSSHPYDKHCNTDLLHSYNMHGLDSPQEISLEMCPNVHSSCCKKTDQLEMYANWIHSKEKENVEGHYRGLSDDYNTLIKQVSEVHKFAEKTIKKLEVKRVANCKVIAERILTFKTAEIQDQIIKNLRKMEDFFTSTYQGFYCSICNHDNHKHFNTENNTVNFSEKFCRDIVEHTLPVVIFWHADVVKYFNLVSKFLLSCDYKGDYKADALIPKNMIFVEDELVEKQLGECRDFRNKKSWFAYCGDLCQAFSISKFSSFFEPNRDQIKEFTEFIKTNLFKVMSMEGKDPAFIEKPGVKNTRRMLYDQDATNQTNKKAADAENPEPIIFQAGLQSRVKLDSFKSIFGGEGISMYDDGRNSLINTQMYNEIKTKLHLEHISTTGSPNIDETDKKLIAAMSAKTLTVGILAGLYALFVN